MTLVIGEAPICCVSNGNNIIIYNNFCNEYAQFWKPPLAKIFGVPVTVLSSQHHLFAHNLA